MMTSRDMRILEMQRQRMSKEEFRTFKEQYWLAKRAGEGVISKKILKGAIPVCVKSYMDALTMLRQSLAAEHPNKKEIKSALERLRLAVGEMAPGALGEYRNVVCVSMQRFLDSLRIMLPGGGRVSFLRHTSDTLGSANGWRAQSERVKRERCLRKLGGVGELMLQFQTDFDFFSAGCRGKNRDGDGLASAFLRANAVFSKIVLNYAEGDIIINVGPEARVVVNRRKASYFEEKPRKRHHVRQCDEEEEEEKRNDPRRKTKGQLKAGQWEKHQVICRLIVAGLDRWRAKQLVKYKQGLSISEPSVPELTREINAIANEERDGKIAESKVRRHLENALGYKLDNIKEITRHHGLRDPKDNSERGRQIRELFADYKDVLICLYWAALSMQNPYFVKADRQGIERLAKKIDCKVESYRYIVELIPNWWREGGPSEEARHIFEDMP